MSPPAGYLIAIEGGEGAGKSTQAERLAARLGAELTREPGGTPAGESIRAVLLAGPTERLDPLTELFLFAAQRAQHCALVVGPALAAGRTVVSDRFSASTLAYQGYGRGLDLGLVRWVCDVASGGRWPDLNLVLEVPTALGARRRGRPADRIEREDAGFHARVAAGFAALAAADPGHYALVDGTGEPDQVHQRVLAAVTARLGTIGPR